MKLYTALIIMFLLLLDLAGAAERSADQWFALVVKIDRDIAQADLEGRRIDKIDAEDRRFVRKMVNELSVSQDAAPTPAQAKWLNAIEQWVRK
jgi:hypothetical protein